MRAANDAQDSERTLRSVGGQLRREHFDARIARSRLGPLFDDRLRSCSGRRQARQCRERCPRCTAVGRLPSIARSKRRQARTRRPGSRRAEAPVQSGVNLLTPQHEGRRDNVAPENQNSAWSSATQLTTRAQHPFETTPACAAARYGTHWQHRTDGANGTCLRPRSSRRKHLDRLGPARRPDAADLVRLGIAAISRPGPDDIAQSFADLLDTSTTAEASRSAASAQPRHGRRPCLERVSSRNHDSGTRTSRLLNSSYCLRVLASGAPRPIMAQNWRGTSRRSRYHPQSEMPWRMKAIRSMRTRTRIPSLLGSTRSPRRRRCTIPQPRAHPSTPLQVRHPSPHRSHTTSRTRPTAR